MNIKKIFRFFLPQTAKTILLSVIFVWFAVIFFISCTSISPVSGNRERAGDFLYIDDIKAHWREFFDGIGYFHGKISSPKIEFHALKIDLFSPNIEIFCGGGELSASVSTFARNNNLYAAVNAVPFDVSSSKEGQPIKNMGVVISGGVLLSPANPRYDALVFFQRKDSQSLTAAVINQSELNKLKENILHAAGGFYKILAGGELTQRTLSVESRHPRSAAGVSKDGRYLYLLVIDGRRAASIGATEKETADLLLSLGSWDAINFDGGGSSSLVMRHPDGNIKPVNTPIHGGIQGLERAVAGCVGVRIKSSSSSEEK